MGQSIRDLLWELVEKIEASEADLDSLPAVAVFACAMLLLQRRREARPDGGEYLTPEAAAREYGLDLVRLKRQWRRLPYCEARPEGGRGFRVSRAKLEATIGIGRGGRVGGAGASGKF